MTSPTPPASYIRPPRAAARLRSPINGVRSAIDTELVDVERDAELLGDGQEVEHAVRGAAGRRDPGDGVLDRCG